MNRQQAVEEKLRILDGIIDAGGGEEEEVEGLAGQEDFWARLRNLSMPPQIPLEMYIPKMRW